MILAPDWMFYIEQVSKAVLYTGIGFGAFTLATFKWIEFIFNTK
tara:strand:- start:1768 stop:1899 length:132 start_codon:yes stop_codon:yes gene_type:complete